jgi:hypothetical protein
MDDESTQPLRAAGSADEPPRPSTSSGAPVPPTGPAPGNVSPAPETSRYRTPSEAHAAGAGAVPPPPPPPPAHGAVPPTPPGHGAVPPAPPTGPVGPAGHAGLAGSGGYGGYAAPGGYGPPPPRRYPAPVGWVIAAVILFWPTAIPALLASHRAAAAGGAGDVVMADRESATAKRWSIVSVCVGGGLIVLSILFSIVWAILVATTFHNDHGRVFEERPGPAQQQPFHRGPRNMPFNPGPGGGVAPKQSPVPSPTATP